MEKNICQHKNQINDYHEGTIVCLDCSYVIHDQFFLDEDCNLRFSHEKKEVKQDVNEILQRLNLTYDGLPDPINTTVDTLYKDINKNSVVTIKEFSAVTGLTEKNIVKKNKLQVCKINTDLLLEKYCKLFNINYQNYTVIKEQLNLKEHSGHPPLTIIGYFIYRFLKTNSHKISIKTVCKTLGISPVSIQRYRKYELSLRT
jgi:transcription initiation factor TFIIIB Brf1 subunit/transcription initiation factor TFIIB